MQKMVKPNCFRMTGQSYGSEFRNIFTEIIPGSQIGKYIPDILLIDVLATGSHFLLTFC